MDLATFVAEWLTGSILGIIALGAAGSALFAGVMQAFWPRPSLWAVDYSASMRHDRAPASAPWNGYQSNPLLGIARLIFLATFAMGLTRPT